MKAFCSTRNFTAMVYPGRDGQAKGHGATLAKDKDAPHHVPLGTPYFHKFGEAFKCKILRFGQKITYLVETKRKTEEPKLKFAPKTRTAIFFGYKVAPGGKWKG